MKNKNLIKNDFFLTQALNVEKQGQDPSSVSWSVFIRTPFQCVNFYICGELRDLVPLAQF